MLTAHRLISIILLIGDFDGVHNMQKKQNTFHWVVASVCILYLFAHGYRFSNNIYTHDSLMLIYQNDQAWQVALGRFMNPLLVFLRGGWTNPWLISVCAILWFILAAFFLTDLLQVKDTVAILLVAGIMTTNITVTATSASFLPWMDFYALSCLLAILGVWLCNKKTLLSCLAGICAFTVSLGIYQAYICVAITLFILLLIQALQNGISLRAFCQKAGLYAGALLSSALLYYIIWKIFQKILGIWTANTYNGLSDVGNYSDTSVLQIIGETYRRFFLWLLYPDTFATVTFHQQSLSAVWLLFLRIANGILLLSIPVCLILLNRRKKTLRWQKILQAILVVLFPFGCNFVYFLSKDTGHTLMIYAFFLFYIWAIVLILETFHPRKYPVYVLLLPIVLILWNNIVYANQVYLKKELIVEASDSLMTRLVYDIEHSQDYIPGTTPVAFIGNFSRSSYVTELDGFEEINIYGMGKTALTYAGLDYMYLNTILNVNMNLTRIEVFDDDTLSVLTSMPEYPASGSIAYINDTLVVKISDWR